MNKIFNQKLFPDAYDCLVISSDEEPDDVVAKGVLIFALQRANVKLPQLWITGEGNVSKVEFVRNQARVLGVDCEVVQGDFSQRLYPLEMLNIYASSPSFSSSTDAASSPVPTPAFLDNLPDEVQKLYVYLQKYENPLFVMLKPCYELFQLPSALLAKLTVAAYGSFNFRCLFEKCNDRSILSSFFNNSFKRFVLYETFFVMGEDNSINSINAPLFFNIIRDKATAGDEFWKGVQKCISIWNNHIVLSQLRSVSKVSQSMFDGWSAEDAELTSSVATVESKDIVWKKRKTNVDKILLGGAKIVNSIIVARGQQMVFADFGLTAMMCAESESLMTENSVVQCDIAFDEGRGNTTIIPNSSGKVFCIKNIDKKQLTTLLETLISK